MTKQELVHVVAEKAEVKKSDAQKAVDALIFIIGSELQKGEKVRIDGLGTFETGMRSARVGRNPQTGETMEIAASKTVKFKASKTLKDKLN